MIRIVALLGALLLNGCATGALLTGVIIGSGLSEGQPIADTVPPERDFFTSGRPVAALELQCARLQHFRVSDTQYIVEGCDQRASYVLWESAAGLQWTRDGDIINLPAQPRPVVAAVGRCDEGEVAELTQAGVSGSAIQRACDAR